MSKQIDKVIWGFLLGKCFKIVDNNRVWELWHKLLCNDNRIKFSFCANAARKTRARKRNFRVSRKKKGESIIRRYWKSIVSGIDQKCFFSTHNFCRCALGGFSTWKTAPLNCPGITETICGGIWITISISCVQTLMIRENLTNHNLWLRHCSTCATAAY